MAESPQNLKCDICHAPATRWYGMSSSAVCTSEACYQEHERRMVAWIAELEAQDQFGRDMNVN